jgi:glyoxylase-like metal-dependent hydrolase (beta-lactamase superfamily II)
MKLSRSLSIVLLLGLVLAASQWQVAIKGQAAKASAETRPPELAYYEAVNKVGPPQDPQLLFLLMGQYSNSNKQAEGVEFLSERLKEFGPHLTDVQKALYLSAIGLLRAQHSSDVSLLHRYTYVKETISTLDQAKQLSGGKIFVVNWISGVVRAQLPGFFGQRKAAQEELTWCVKNSETAPHAGWMREVYYYLGKLADDNGEKTEAQDFLHKTGYAGFNRPITLITPFSEQSASGHTFAPRRITEVVPHKVYALSGLEFTEYYFIASEDGRELIGIDAGTRPDAAKSAYEALRKYAPHLPELTTILVTHAHWDHIGGHKYFRSLNPRIRFYGRSNYQEEVTRELNAPGNFAKQFFGEKFDFEDVRSYKPDVGIDRRTDLKIGGTRLELIPIDGGETHDGMFIYMPDQHVMFVGDFIMPYLGAPLVEEGNFEGLLDAIDVLVQKNPQYLLHGHEPLTRNFASTAMLAQLKNNLSWLREQVLESVRKGDERSSIHQANLIPPDFFTGRPDAFQPYIILREHVIDRLYDQNVGYWHPDLYGLDHLGTADRAELLVNYLGVSDKQVAKAVEHMAADGKYELAASLLESSGDRFADSESVARARRLVYLKLMEKNQNTDPFKFIIYSGKIGEHTPALIPGN